MTIINDVRQVKCDNNDNFPSFASRPIDDNCSVQQTTGGEDSVLDTSIPIISDKQQLHQYGVIAMIPIISHELTADIWKKWAKELTVVTPEIMTAEGDGTYAFYRNILEEPNFPFESILRTKPNNNETNDIDNNIVTSQDNSCIAQLTEIGKAIIENFPINSLDDIKLDDAFCVHYNMDQIDTTGAKHMDPSDITINICLEKSDHCSGSNVMFYGTKKLKTNNNDINWVEEDESFRFLVNQQPGYATLHWGNHPHETTRLCSGTRTNIVLTYCYTDATKSDVTLRTCYM
jgi:hypothetical protein